jgi:hypothetical protein
MPRQLKYEKDSDVVVEQGLQIACGVQHTHDLDSSLARQVENNVASKGKASQAS